MPEVSIEVAGRPYRIRCGEGEEAHVTRMASMIDAEASKLVASLGQMPEGRLMLMSALMIADQLDEAKKAAAEAERRAVNAEKLAETKTPPSDLFSPEREEEIAKNLDALADRIEALAGRVAGSA